jgi:hypothetical protein
MQPAGEHDPMMLALIVLEERIELRAAVQTLWAAKVQLEEQTAATADANKQVRCFGV